MRIQIINGPNINLLGKREPSIYGSVTFEDYLAELRKKYADVQIDYFQSNIEGELIDKIQQVGFDVDGIILNAGAYTHYSYAIRDAIEAVQDFTPYVEVHMSDIHQREDFRRISVLTPVCVKQICGFGKDSYKMGIDLLLEIL